MQRIPGTADAHLVQVLDYPTLQVDVDRQRAAQLGLSQRDVANIDADVAVVELAGGAVVLLEPAEQRQLHRGGQDAARSRSIRSANLLDTPLTPSCRRAVAAGGRRGAAECAVRRLGDIASVSPRSSLESGQPLHGAARARHRRQRRRARPRIGGGRHRERRSTSSAKAAHGHQDPVAGRTRSCRVVPQPRARPDPGRDPGLLLDGGAVPVVARSVHHHDGGAGRAGRHLVDADGDAHHDQRRVADGCDHGGRHRGVELDPAGELRQRSARARGSRAAARRRSRPARPACARC